MKKPLVLLLLFTLSFARFGDEQFNMAGENVNRRPSNSYGDRGFIDSVGDIRAIMGIGKSICVSGGGEAIAVLYGAPSGDPDNSMLAAVAYSLDHGATWTRYGPFSDAVRRMYNDVDGAPDFHIAPGQLFFIWDESTLGYNDGLIKVMIEENIPSAPSFSPPDPLPNSQPPAMYPHNPSIAVAQDNPSHIVVTAIDGLSSWAYCWVSWSDPIPMAHIEGAPGKVRQGTNGYVLYCYTDLYYITPTESTHYPYFIESIDGGYTWGSETPIPGFPVGSASQFWWCGFDCEVINNAPWAIYTDIGTPGGGPYIAKGTGSPGNWTWEIWDAGQLGTCSLTIADTTFYCYPGFYPSLSHNPVSNTILASYKAHYYKEYAGTIYYDGAHIGGIYTTDNGTNWTISQPLSDANTTQIPWGDWSTTEVAHRLVNINGNVYSYAIWIDGTALVLYFERGLVKSFLPLAIDEHDVASIPCNHLQINPSISKGKSIIQFYLSRPGNIVIDLYDTNGRLVRILHEGHFPDGYHSIDLQTYDLPNGIYFVSLEGNCENAISKVVLVQ